MEILIIYHTQTGNTERMARSAAGGVESISGVSAKLLKARQAGLEDLKRCQGLLIGSPENFGYMSGMIKDFFDRTYERAQGRKDVFRKPYAVFISAGNDGSGALASIERICLGYQFKKVAEPVVAKGALTDQALESCFNLGATLAAGCEAGIF